MKNIILSFVAFFTFSLAISSQNQSTKIEKYNEAKTNRWSISDRAERLSRQLKLSNAEKMEIELYFMNVDRRREETFEKLKKLQKGDKTREQILEDEHIKNDTELRTIIGSEKMNKYIQIREDQEYKKRK